MKNIKEIKRDLAEMLDEERYLHSLAVEKTAVELAKYYGADEAKARLAGLLHDISRYLDAGGSYIDEAKKRNLHIDEVAIKQPKLLHAALSAEIAREKFGIEDPEIIKAIKHHTQGEENMGLLEKIIYLADHMEPDRNYPQVGRVRKLAYSNLDQAIVESINAMLAYLEKEGLPISEKTIKTRNAYLSRGKR